MRSHLSPLDVVFLELEQNDDAVQMHLGWTAVFDPLADGKRPSLERLRGQARRRLVGNSALRRRLSMPRVDLLSLPIWLPDPDFDVGEQIHSARLPEPGGEAELMDWAGEYFSRRLDRSRPLWEVTLLEGLEGGRWALVCKVHHCLIDGLSGTYIAAALLDIEPETEEDATALGEMESSMGKESERGVLWRLRGAVGEEVSGGIDATLHAREVASIVSRSRERVEALVRDGLSAAPATILNGRTGVKRRVAGMEVPLEDAKQVKRELGGKLDDVVLAATAGGLRRLFQQRGEEAVRVRAAVPLSLLRASESLVLGDDVAPFFLDLPLAEPDPLRRYRQISNAARELRSATGAEAMAEADRPEAALVQSTFARLAFTPGLFNLTIANVPTSPVPLYCLGSPMRRTVPMGSIFSGHNLGIAAASYNGMLYFGLVADREALPDLAVLRTGIKESLAELAMVAA
jgi:diacylglycerol O-acyltransferase / wax synthase